MTIKFTKTDIKLDEHGNVVGAETKEFLEQNVPAASTARGIIGVIQFDLGVAATLLNDARNDQQQAIDEALEGNFTSAVDRARAAGSLIRSAKMHEAEAARLLVQLIPQMRAEGFAEAIIFGVVETLIAEFLGA